MGRLITKEVSELLNDKYLKFNNLSFIESDPICIPHRFSRKQDIEVSGFFAAILAWGQRKTIINKCSELLLNMDNAPYDFVCNASDRELKNLENFFTAPSISLT